jgi:hypothetical protein
MNICADGIDRRLCEATLETILECLPPLRTEHVQVSCNRDEWQDVNDLMWDALVLVCGGTWSTFDFYTPYCRPGYQDTKLRTLACRVPLLQELKIQDGLYGYEATLREMASNFQCLSRLSLKNACPRETLTRACCEPLESLIRSSAASLTFFQLWNVKVECLNDFRIVEKALLACEKLEGVDTYRICTASSAEDLSSVVAANRELSENFAVAQYLKNRYGDVPSTAEKRLEATLYVRTGGTELSQVRKADLQSGASCCFVLATLSDRPSLIYHYLRNEADPSTWSAHARV